MCTRQKLHVACGCPEDVLGLRTALENHLFVSGHHDCLSGLYDEHVIGSSVEYDVLEHHDWYSKGVHARCQGCVWTAKVSA
jgi:hypothetical protein